MASEDMWPDSSEEDGEGSVDLIFGLHHPSTLQQLLEILPPRPVVDRILSAYFNTKWLILREYQSREEG